MTENIPQPPASGRPAPRPVPVPPAAILLLAASLLGAGCASRSGQAPAPVSSGPNTPGGVADASTQSDLASLAALPPAQRGAYLQQHRDMLQRIYTSHDQAAKIQLAQLLRQR